MAHTTLRCLLLFATFLLIDVTFSLQWRGPAQTVYADDQWTNFGWSPQPTASPELRKRQAGNDSICGYVDNNVSEPVSCPDAYCGIVTLGGTPAADCCTSSLANGNLTGCFPATTCYDYASCDASCSSANAQSYYASCFSSAPYCGLLSYTEGGAISFFCTDTPDLTFLAGYTTGAAPNSSESTTVVQSSSSSAGISVSSSASDTATSFTSSFTTSDTSSITASPVPFTQSQQSADTTSQALATTSTVSSNSGAPAVPAGHEHAAILVVMIMLGVLW